MMNTKRIIHIDCERFYLRTLSESDVTHEYCSWFEDELVKKYISFSNGRKDIKEVKAYVKERCEREDVIFLGIFNKDDDKHIGNIKYEPINIKEHYAIIGILIGDPLFRGNGIAKEVITASGLWLKKNFGIREIHLGVSMDNHSAIKAYTRIGFVFEKSSYIPLNGSNGKNMIWRLQAI